ncbi:MAG: Gfo/Idh/MocA family oxidoreductase [Armatimonadota bacterium]
MTVRWSIVGCGDITNKAVAPAINEQPDAEIVSFFSNTAERAEQMRREHGAERSTTNLPEAIEAEDVDAVYVASPVHRHAAETIAAVRAGKHVICEKPMALTVAAGERMIDAAEDAGVHLSIAYYRRFFEKSRRIRSLLEHGAIGVPIACEISICSRPAIGVDSPKYWRFMPEKSGGGALMDIGSHRLDLACYFLGPAKEVSGYVDTLDRGGEMQVPDTECILARMENGAHLHCTASWATPASADEFVIRGTEGTIETLRFDQGPLVLRRAGDEEQFDLSMAENWHYPLIDDFTRALVEGREPQFTGRDGLQASRIMEACYHSSETGKSVRL